MEIRQNRRRFLTSASLAAAAGALGARAPLAAEGPPETTTIRLKQDAAICFAPVYVVEAFLRTEGFADIQYVDAGLGIPSGEMLAEGDLDFDITFAGTVVYHLDMGRPVTAVGGLHVGCYELFAREPIRSIGDLKGRSVGIHTLRSSGHLYLSIMAKHVGLDPNEDIEWVPSPEGSRALDLFAAGETEAFLGFPPEPQELRSRGYRRVILNTIVDRPWSQYFCCLLYGNRAWVSDHPVATRAAQQLVDRGFVERYDYALETIETVPYDLWHEYDPEDTMRFYALRLHEAGMIENNPNTLIADGTDWRFVNELKREMKA